MIEQALRVANKLGLPPDQTARLLVAAEQRGRRFVSLVGAGSFGGLESVHILSNTVEVPYLNCPVFIDDRKPRGARRGQRLGGNSWD